MQKSFNLETQADAETRNDDATGNREISAQLRSRGTVQSSRWTFKQRTPDEKWFVVVTRQDRDWNHPDVADQEPYALVVTVADRDNEEAQLYAEIQTAISLQVKNREQERVRQVQGRAAL